MSQNSKYIDKNHNISVLQYHIVRVQNTVELFFRIKLMKF